MCDMVYKIGWWTKAMTKFIECIWVSLSGSDIVSNDLHDHLLVWPTCPGSLQSRTSNITLIKATTIVIAKAANKTLSKTNRNMNSKSDNKTSCNANNNFFAKFVNNSH